MTDALTEDRARMNADLDRLMDPHFRCAIINARRISGTKFKKAANWVLAMEVLGLGSTYAWFLCERHGLDPEATR